MLVNFDEDGKPFVRWIRQVFGYGGFQWYGGTPVGRDSVNRDEKWSEEEARRAGY